MPWETTENYIRSGHRSMDLFVKNSMKTITLSEEKGIKAVIGKLKSDPNGNTHVQSYLFSKAKGWTLNKAKAWFRSHKSSYEPADPNGGHERSFIAGLLSFAVKDGKRTGTFYLMNTSRNRNRWAVTDKALEEGLPTLKGKPLGMGKGYKIDKHYPAGEVMDAGKFVSTEKPGSYALGTAEISDDQTWRMMQNNELGAVSVVIYSYQDTCSKCGADLSKIMDPYGTHECLAAKGSSAYIKVESFSFKRVDFVDVPAYPQAGLTEMQGAQPNSTEYTHAIELLAGVYESQERPKQGVTKQGANQNLPEQEKELKELKEKLANSEQDIEKLKADLKAAKEDVADKDKKIKDLNAKLEDNDDNDDNAEEVKALKDKVAAMEKEKRDAIIAATLKARKDAGVAGEDKEEKEMLAKLSEEALEVLKDDALKVAAITKKTASTPGVKYEADSKDKLQAAVDKQRDAWGFPEREKPTEKGD